MPVRGRAKRQTRGRTGHSRVGRDRDVQLPYHGVVSIATMAKKKRMTTLLLPMLLLTTAVATTATGTVTITARSPSSTLSSPPSPVLGSVGTVALGTQIAPLIARRWDAMVGAIDRTLTPHAFHWHRPCCHHCIGCGEPRRSNNRVLGSHCEHGGVAVITKAGAGAGCALSPRWDWCSRPRFLPHRR